MTQWQLDDGPHYYCGTMASRALSQEVCIVPETLAVYHFTHKPHAMAFGRILRPALIHTTFERDELNHMSLTIFDIMTLDVRLDMPPHSKPQWYHVCALSKMPFQS